MAIMTQEREERLETTRPSTTTLDGSMRDNNETVITCEGNFSFCDDDDDNHGKLFLKMTSNASLLSDSSSSSSDEDELFKLHYYTRSEIQRHNTEASAWIVAGDDIYDVTDYAEVHPGGKYSIMKKIGGAVDCTQDMMFHSKSGQKHWKQYLVGKVTTIPSKNGLPVEKEWWRFWE